MGLLNKAMANAKKEEERGEGLLSRAGRYAEEWGGTEVVESTEKDTKPSQAKDVEKEMESLFFEPSPPQEGRGGGKRRGLLKRALAVSDEPPAGKRPARRERRRAEKAARMPFPAEAFEPEAPAVEPAAETPFVEMPPVEMPAVEELSFTEPALVETPEAEVPEEAEPSAALMGAGEVEFTVEEIPSTGLLDSGVPFGKGAEETQFPDFEEKEEEEPHVGEPPSPSEEAGGEAVEAAFKIDSEGAGKRKGGLLARASLFAEKEGIKGKAIPRARPAARQAVRPAAPGPAKAVVSKKPPRTPAAKRPATEAKRPERAVKVQVTKKEEPAQQPGTAAPAGAVLPAEIEAELPEAAGAPGAGLPAELKDFAASLESRLIERDALSALDLFNASVAREGHTSFIFRLLETMTSLGKGKSGLLFAHSNERYVVELRVPPFEKQAKLKNVSFRKDSRFIQSLKECERGFFRPGGRKGEGVRKETAALGSLSPWMAVPLVIGSELVAFFAIGKQPDRPRMDEEAVALLARLSAPYVNKYLLLKEHRFALSSLEKELKERDTLYSLYSAFERPREKLQLPERCVLELVKKLSANLGIVSAVVLADWKPKGAAGPFSPGIGNYLPVVSIGVPEKAISRYRVSMKDREIRSIVETGRVAVPKDAPKRMETLSRYAAGKAGGTLRDNAPPPKPKWPRSFIVVPLLFNGETLGLLVVHDMKGVGKTLTQEAAGRLRHASSVLVPGLLYGKLLSLSPFDVMRELVARQVDEAKRENMPLAVAVFTIENGKKAYHELGFGKYRAVVEQLRSLIENVAGENGVVKEIDWNRLALFFRERGENEVDDAIARVRTDFSSGLRKSEREAGLSLATHMTRYPRDSTSAEDILFTVM